MILALVAFIMFTVVRVSLRSAWLSCRAKRVKTLSSAKVDKVLDKTLPEQDQIDSSQVEDMSDYLKQKKDKRALFPLSKWQDDQDFISGSLHARLQQNLISSIEEPVSSEESKTVMKPHLLKEPNDIR